MEQHRKIILVANSDHTFDINQHITENDIIVRFNIPKASTLAQTGSRTDLLFLANTVDVVQKKMKKNSKFINFTTTINNPFSIIFAYSDELIQKIKPLYKRKVGLIFRKLTSNFNNIEYQKFLNSLGYSVKVVPDQYYLNLKQHIDPNTKMILSTGIIATQYFLNEPQYQNDDIYLHGFSFEGWDGHAWNHEKLYIDKLIQSNQIHLFIQIKPDV